MRERASEEASVRTNLYLADRNPLRSSISGSDITVGAFSDPNRRHQICTFCVMDTTDPAISFDEDGVCHHCERARQFFSSRTLGNPEEIPPSAQGVLRQKRTGDYDCLIGLSGGVDSSYLLVQAVRWGLRPLVVHIDAGWNSEIAVGNIFRLVDKLGLDLHTEVLDWDVLRRAQIAFLRSGVSNLDIPQDHAFIASLLKVAIAEGVETVLTGSNMATESILPTQWGYDALDGNHIRGVFRKFGEGDFQSYPLFSLRQFRYDLPRKYRIKFLNPLDEVEYSKKMAVSLLSDEFGWQDYGGKHYESVWTKYFQGHLLPYRFGYDKRKAHLSSRIASGELSRAEAISELKKPLYEERALRLDEEFVASKLEISSNDLQRLKETSLRHYSDYPNDENVIRIITFAARRTSQIGRLGRRWLRRALGGSVINARGARGSQMDQA